MAGPWSQEEVCVARQVRFSAVLVYLGAYHKVDRDFVPQDERRKSLRVHVNYGGRDFRFIFTGEKWLNELVPQGEAGRGGGGAIDFVRHLTGYGFVQAVKICLDAKASIEPSREG